MPEKNREFRKIRENLSEKCYNLCYLPVRMKDWTKRYHRVVAPVGFKGAATRKAYYCRSANAAKELRADIQRWRRERAAPPRSFLAITEEDQRWLGYLKNRLGDLNKLPEIVDHYERTAKAVTEPMQVPVLCNLFLAQPRKRRCQGELQHLINAFKLACFHDMAHEVTPEQIRRFLESSTSPTQARNRYRALSVLFKFARERRAIVIDPLAEVKRPRVQVSAPGILTVQEFTQLLQTAQGGFSELIPYLTIAGFAGLRRREMIAKYPEEAVLQWSDVMFDKRLILVRPEVAKTSRRRFPQIEDALAHWIDDSLRKTEGAVIPHGEGWFKERFAKLCAAAKVAPTHNALRHSFASYFLARTGEQGVGRCAVILGNSESVARSHYIESLMPGDGDAWFGIRRGGEQKPAEPEHGIYVTDPTTFLGLIRK
jgi:integrase